MERSHEEDDSCDPKLDCEEGRKMKAKTMKRPMIDPASQEQGVSKKPTSQRPTDALTSAVVRGVEDTTGSLMKKMQRAKGRSPP